MEKYWYRVDIVEAGSSRVLIGTSEMTPEQLIQHLQNDQYLELTDLSYRDNQNRLVSWSVWDPRLAAVAYVNPRFVTKIMPFVGDPHTGSSPTDSPTNPN